MLERVKFDPELNEQNWDIEMFSMDSCTDQ